jgi:ATP-dependent 26S proteasome regulatory subunit
MQYVVEFKEPDRELRLKLWQVLCPPKLPLAKDVDFKKLAKDYEFTGGEIKKAIIRAATKRAVKLEQERALSMNDFVSACLEVANHKWNKFRKLVFQKMIKKRH